MPPRIHLGINTCFAVKRWPEPDRWVHIVTDELGLDCCQVSLDLVDPLLDQGATDRYAMRIRRAAEAAGMTIHSTFTGLAAYSWSQLLHPDEALRDATMRWYEQAIRFSVQLGARGAGGHLGAFSVADSADSQRRALLLDELRGRVQALSQTAARHGLDFLMFENMAVAREWGHRIEEAQWLAQIPTEGGAPVVLCLDLGHPCALHTGTPSDDYLSWLAHSWPHTPVIHLQQTDRTGDHHWPFTAQYNEVGMVHAARVVEALRRWDNSAEVYLFLEAIHPFEAEDAVVVSDLRESVQYWREALASVSAGVQ